ncbi:glycosyltransferase [Natronorubrum texcoconense]|uniref:Glycosyl transferase family 21 n=1 Tax=Natronorubrum texcoconense TaxID=1095776 RepID=A0A1G9B3X0_9EURY|nr:glycosyltransferase [Natronorubrum texcoconense]SDK34266.1 Glycosyl transferase family 21 [Natronorubrum texcoconense]
MASIILPTHRWTPAAEIVVDTLRDDDELLVVCDSHEDPVVDDAPSRATVVTAGEPVGCSGKANALATGMERASDEIVVWTDDDVSREDGWLERLVTHARETGAATEVPVFVGGGLWRLFEPAMVVLGTSGTASGNYVWGGGVAFDRTELDESALLADLRRTVGDDTLLSTYVDDVWVDTDHVRPVHVDGSPEGVYNRIARFGKTSAFFEPVQTGVLFAISLVFVVVTLVFPLLAALGSTLVGIAAYRKLELERPSVLLTFPSFLFVPLFLAVGVAAPTFRWGGRTYRWEKKFDVIVVDS